MCKEAVNRAAILEQVLSDEKLKKALVLYGYSSLEWDAPDADKVKTKLEDFAEIAKSVEEL